MHKAATAALRLAASLVILACFAQSLPLDCPINKHTESEIIAEQLVSKDIINIKLASGACIEVFFMSTPTSYITSRAQNCVMCVEGSCIPLPSLPPPPKCDAVMGPDCGVYFTAKGDRKKKCAP